MTSSEIAFAIFIAKHNLPMAVGDEFGLLAKKMWCSTVPVAHPGGEKNTNYCCMMYLPSWSLGGDTYNVMSH